MEIRFRRKDLVKTMRRVDPVYISLAERLGTWGTPRGALAPGAPPWRVIFVFIYCCLPWEENQMRPLHVCTREMILVLYEVF